jgi:K(+)-stimulated pyrophosphate-energized sodium pump
MAIGFTFTKLYPGETEALGLWGSCFPLFLSAWGIISSIAGCLFISTNVPIISPVADKVFSFLEGKIGFFKKVMDKIRGGDAAFALRVGLFASGIIMILGTFVLSLLFFFSQGLNMFLSVTSGVLAAIIIGYVTEYFTSSDYKPVKRVAYSSGTGPATVILSGISLGMISIAIPVIIICLSILISYALSGIFGVACAAVGMLSITGISLSVDAYGPISDNAGGIAEMSELPEEVREITDKLDSIATPRPPWAKGSLSAPPRLRLCRFSWPTLRLRG